MTYGPSPVKRVRWTDDQLAELDDSIVLAVEEDHPVSLRGVYYRVVSAGAVEKTEAGYNRVLRQLLKLRRSGRIPYSRITDGTRWITKPRTWTSTEAALRHEGRYHRLALWHDQPNEVQIFTEKDAISGAILPTTKEWDVPLGVLRGYSSETFAHSVATSIVASNAQRSGITYVYQLGDHDPSGLDAWRDFTKKVSAFITELSDSQGYTDDLADYVRFERLAVTEEQIRELDLPTRPTKKKDTRAKKFTGGSVEVDAIPAPVLRNLVEEAITQHMDLDRLDRLRAVEREGRNVFLQMAETFEGVA